MTIPASTIVSVTPGVLSAGGAGLVLNGLVLSQYSLLPVGAPVAFPDALSVSNYFGATSVEAGIAAVYFAGYNNGTQTPSSLLFVRHAASAVGAFLRGGEVVATVEELQAIIPGVVTGSITTTTLTVTAVTSGALEAGQLLTGTGVSAGTRIVAQLTGAEGGIGTYSVSISQTVASTTITGAYDLTVTVDGVAKTASSLNLSAGASYSAIAAIIQTGLSLSGGQTCTYSSQFGAFVISSATTGATSTVTVGSGAAASILALTTAAGATLSQGNAAQTPTEIMDAVILSTQNWAGFMTTTEPSNADKLLFADWTTAQTGKFAYVCYDDDTTAASESNNTSCFGYTLARSDNSGTCLIGASSGNTENLIDVASFVLGAIASLNFDSANGRITFAFKSAGGVLPTVDDATSAANLIGNGYNYYGAYATANEDFNFFYPGTVSGAYGWLDAYVNALWLNAQIQLAIMVGFTNTPSVPYNASGYALIKAWASDPIKQAVAFGAIRSGVTLSAAQIAQVNQAAGIAIDKTLVASGWYFQVTPATAEQRANRESPECTLWYTDGGSVQKLNIASIDIQ